MPSDSEIEPTIRKIIANLYATDNLADITVKRVRAAAEKACGLPAGYLKTEDAWNERSKTFIEEEAARQGEELEQRGNSADRAGDELYIIKRTEKRPSQGDPNEPRKRQKTKAAENEDGKTGRAQQKQPANKIVTDDGKEDAANTEKPVQRKALPRRRIIESDDESSIEEDEPKKDHAKESPRTMNEEGMPNVTPDADMPNVTPDADINETKSSTPKKSQLKNHSVPETKMGDESESDISSLEDNSPPPKKLARRDKSKPQKKPKNTAKTETKAKSSSPAKSQSPQTKVDASDSELSSLIDDTPKSKKVKSMKNTSKAQKPSKSKITKGNTKDENLDPIEAEIKSLQGWLLKCGIRKLWHRELAPYKTSKEKVAHLKQMLKDVGMVGRYSLDKARKIKDRRELELDLEAVQDFSKKFGAEGNRKGGVTAMQALQDVGFDMEDGEETD